MSLRDCPYIQLEGLAGSYGCRGQKRRRALRPHTSDPHRSNDRHDHRDVSTSTITKIMVEVLTVLAIVSKELKRGPGEHGRQNGGHGRQSAIRR